MNDKLELLTVKEVAAILKLNEQTVYRKIASGQIISNKLGGTVRISRENLEEYIKSTEVKKNR